MAKQRKGIQSVEHGARLLESLIDSRQAVPLKTLAGMAGLSPSMAHRYLTSFIRADLVRQDPASGHYDLGTLALRLGIAALNRTDFIQVADDEFKDLVRRVNIDGHLSVWGDYGVTIVRIHNRHVPILSNLRLGGVLPLYDSAAGRIFLAYQGEKTIKSVLQSELDQAESPKPTKRAIAAVIADVRARGYASIDSQVFHGVRALAAPIFDLQGDLRAAMSLVSNQASLVDFPNRVLDDLVTTAKHISRRLGWAG